MATIYSCHPRIPCFGHPISPASHPTSAPVLTKILFTAAVIVLVAIIFRVKATRTVPASQSIKPKQGAATDTGVSPAVIAYTLLGLVVVASVIVFFWHWNAQHQIMEIQVRNSAGEVAHYQAYRKSIKGRKFTTLDGKRVTLGDSDRIEMQETD